MIFVLDKFLIVAVTRQLRLMLNLIAVHLGERLYHLEPQLAPMRRLNLEMGERLMVERV